MWMDLISLNQQSVIPYLEGDKECDLIIRAHGDGRCKMKLSMSDEYRTPGEQISITDADGRMYDELSVPKGEYKYTILTPRPGYLLVDIQAKDITVYMCITDHYDSSGMVPRDIHGASVDDDKENH